MSAPPVAGIRAAARRAIVVTAEHAGNRVPDAYAELFRGAGQLLASHRGWDPGTLDLARCLAERLAAALVTADTTRLLVDLNRSPHNRRVFSELTRPLPRADRARLLDELHRPHWAAVRREVDRLLARGPVLHLAVHSFTPVLDGVRRTPDVALLYDPAREPERTIAAAWAKELAAASPERAVRRNNPYRGSADGLTTALRRVYPATSYVGIEIEINQRHLTGDGRFPDWVGSGLVEALTPAWAPLRRPDGFPITRGRSQAARRAPPPQPGRSPS